MSSERTQQVSKRTSTYTRGRLPLRSPMHLAHLRVVRRQRRLQRRRHLRRRSQQHRLRLPGELEPPASGAAMRLGFNAQCADGKRACTQTQPLQPSTTSTLCAASVQKCCFRRLMSTGGTHTSCPRDRRPYFALRVCNATPPSLKKDCTSACKAQSPWGERALARTAHAHAR